ncbi:MAG: DUF1599 domain-containing protein [Bacteroidetes bacterium]|nr:DUF1599 domain-containing protein [Bacteroidota bacterium]
MSQTPAQFDQVMATCREVFRLKTADYGTAWTVLRLPSLTDQIFIKAKRIRTLEMSGENRVGESVEAEYMGIINYCIMALILCRNPQLMGETGAGSHLEEALATALYDAQVTHIRHTLLKKNHDYGEAWRDMRVSSYTDLILMKLLRIKQIEDNAGSTLISEGVDAGYEDIVNYSVFALIKLTLENV